MDKCCVSFKSENIKTKLNDNIKLKSKTTAVTDFVRFLSQEFMTKILDENIEEIEINGTMIPMYYEYLTKKNINIMKILKNIPTDENIFKNDSDFIKNMNVINLQIQEMLKISNYFNCYQTKYIHKIKQIKHYKWINQDQIDKCVNRMKKIIIYLTLKIII